MVCQSGGPVPYGAAAGMAAASAALEFRLGGARRSPAGGHGVQLRWSAVEQGQPFALAVCARPLATKPSSSGRSPSDTASKTSPGNPEHRRILPVLAVPEEEGQFEAVRAAGARQACWERRTAAASMPFRRCPPGRPVRSRQAGTGAGSWPPRVLRGPLRQAAANPGNSGLRRLPRSGQPRSPQPAPGPLPLPAQRAGRRPPRCRAAQQQRLHMQGRGSAAEVHGPIRHQLAIRSRHQAQTASRVCLGRLLPGLQGWPGWAR